MMVLKIRNEIKKRKHLLKKGEGTRHRWGRGKGKDSGLLTVMVFVGGAHGPSIKFPSIL